MQFVPSPAQSPPGLPTLQQHPNYVATLRTLGTKVETFAARTTDAHLLATALVVRRRFGPLSLAWVPRGPVWSNSVRPEDRVKSLHRWHDDISPRAITLFGTDKPQDAASLRQIGYRQVAKGQGHAWLDLTKDREERFALQHGKWRNRLRHARKSKLETSSRWFFPRQDQPLLQFEIQQRKHLKYRALPPAFTVAWAMANGHGARLFLARDQTGLIGYILVLLHAPTATYHIGWSNPRGRIASCHNLLLWNASNWLAQNGYKALDMGYADPATSPGLTRFKLGMGARLRRTGPTLLALPQLGLPRLQHKAA